MIEHITRMVCDLCGATLDLSKQDTEGAVIHWARMRNWNAQSYFGRHYCPACKVPAKLAKAMEAAQ